MNEPPAPLPGHRNWTTSTVLPMFPLQSVLFPHGLLPLQVFEPRYRALVAACLAGDGRFGVVLIERGSEVGGGDQRMHTGTVATIEQSAELPDGRIAVIARGICRLQVDRWLPEDPYPLGAVRLDGGEDPHTLPGADETTVATAAGAATAVLRRTYALRSELALGPAWPATLHLDPDPESRCWQLCDLAPLGAADRQALLEAARTLDRLTLLSTLLSAVVDDLNRLLALG